MLLASDLLAALQSGDGNAPESWAAAPRSEQKLCPPGFFCPGCNPELATKPTGEHPLNVCWDDCGVKNGGYMVPCPRGRFRATSGGWGANGNGVPGWLLARAWRTCRRCRTVPLATVTALPHHPKTTAEEPGVWAAMPCAAPQDSGGRGAVAPDLPPDPPLLSSRVPCAVVLRL